MTSAVPSAPAARPPKHHCPERMALIPGGSIDLLEEDGGKVRGYPSVVRTFCLDINEATVADYERCIEAGACTTPRVDPRAQGGFCNWPDPELANHPVNCIDWFQARAYCKWNRKRLPTNAEWEYAARGGSEARVYPWGDEPPGPEHACWNRHTGTCPVGTHVKEAFGLYDMGGNVSEWVSDWMGPYPNHVDYVGPMPGKARTLRGASWGADERWMPARIRYWLKPEQRQYGDGVRCARRAESSPSTITGQPAPTRVPHRP